MMALSRWRLLFDDGSILALTFDPAHAHAAFDAVLDDGTVAHGVGDSAEDVVGALVMVCVALSGHGRVARRVLAPFQAEDGHGGTDDGRMRAELSLRRFDAHLAAGELPVTVPEPGTDAARLLVANRLLRHETMQLRTELDRLLARGG